MQSYWQTLEPASETMHAPDWHWSPLEHAAPLAPLGWQAPPPQ
jgi:hypothetical protein